MTLTGIAAVFQAAQEWQVKRILLASAPVVYNGIATLPYRDDQPLPMTAMFSMEVAKKCGELLASYLARHTQVVSVEMRLAGMYGPNYNPTRSSLAGRLVHAAVRGANPISMACGLDRPMRRIRAISATSKMRRGRLRSCRPQRRSPSQPTI